MSPQASPSTIMLTMIGSKLDIRMSRALRSQVMAVISIRPNRSWLRETVSSKMLKGSVGAVRYTLPIRTCSRATHVLWRCSGGKLSVENR
jgi:hypothetical protein